MLEIRAKDPTLPSPDKTFGCIQVPVTVIHGMMGEKPKNNKKSGNRKF